MVCDNVYSRICKCDVTSDIFANGGFGHRRWRNCPWLRSMAFSQHDDSMKYRNTGSNTVIELVFSICIDDTGWECGGAEAESGSPPHLEVSFDIQMRKQARFELGRCVARSLTRANWTPRWMCRCRDVRIGVAGKLVVVLLIACRATRL